MIIKIQIFLKQYQSTRYKNKSSLEPGKFTKTTRERQSPAWHSEYVMEGNVAYCLLTEDEEPSTFQEATNSQDVILWMKAMQEEIEALYKNKTWELMTLP